MPTRTSSVVLLVIFLMLLAACRAQPSTSVASSTLQLPITVRSAGAWAAQAQHYHLSISASCQPGEQLLGGGFSTSDVFESSFTLLANFPSSATTWTASGSSISTFQLGVESYCASASVPLGIQIVQSSNGESVVACPTDTVLLGGGFQGGAGLSRPHGNGWESNANQVYALCAAQHVVAGQVARSAFHVPSAPAYTDPGARGGGSVNCPAGLVATGGGFAEGSVLGSGAETTGDHLSGWSVSANAGADVTVSAVCQILM